MCDVPKIEWIFELVMMHNGKEKPLVIMYDKKVIKMKKMSNMYIFSEKYDENNRERKKEIYMCTKCTNNKKRICLIEV